jgi:hypothetical protein
MLVNDVPTSGREPRAHDEPERGGGAAPAPWPARSGQPPAQPGPSAAYPEQGDDYGPTQRVGRPNAWAPAWSPHPAAEPSPTGGEPYTGAASHSGGVSHSDGAAYPGGAARSGPEPGYGAAETPVSSAPASGVPEQRGPGAEPAYAATGHSPQWSADAAQQWSAEPVSPAQDPLFPDERSPWLPRITPSPPPQRGRLIVGLLIGALAGLLVFGTAGFFVGRSTAPEASGTTGGDRPTPPPTPGPSALPPYEASQLALNKGKFDGELAAFAESWLPWVAGCIRNGEPGGPRPLPAEKTRIFCEIGGLNVFFVEYKSLAERDKAHALRVALNIDARELTPGVGRPDERRGTSGAYAFREGSGATARTVASLWWDDADKPVAGFLQGPWKGLGESWDPLRDVWRRYS